MRRMQRSWIWLIGLALIAGFLGCKRTKAPPASGPPMSWPGQPAAQAQFDTESGPFAAGKKVFAANGCLRCHSVGGAGGGPMVGGPGGPPMAGGPGGPPMMGGPPGGPGMMMMGRTRGPDLGKVGGDPAHTIDWLMEHVRNPKSHKPNSRMPAFGEEKIQKNDLRALAEYLASLK